MLARVGRSSCAVVLALTGVVAACTRATAPPSASPRPGWKLRPLEAPTSAGSGEPNLASAADGRVYLSWIETQSDGVSTLRYASRRPGQAWSAPASVAHGFGWFVNWADFPAFLPLPDGSLVAHWLTKGSGHGYDIRVSISRDAGASWSSPVVPHRDGTPSEHGFVSFAPWPTGGAAVVWLDGRGTVDPPGTDAAVRLFQATLQPDGGVGPETTLDPRVCDCCQTAVVATDRGLLVVYRDRSPTEVRDIAAVRYEQGRWSAPVSLFDDGWEMNGCPVNGPAVAAAGSRVAVAWHTAARDKPRVKVIFSADAGHTFGAPTDVDDGRPIGRVDVALLPDGDALVSWIEQSAAGPELRVRQVRQAGVPRPSLVVTDAASTRSSGFPRLEVGGGEPVLVWRDAREPGRVATAFLVRE